MIIGDQIRMDVKLERVNDVVQLIEQLVTDKNVANVGAAGGIKNYLPDNTDVWLHERINRASKKNVGIDIDYEGIEYALLHDYHILYGNCESIQLDEKFDVIVLSDVIEHVNAPVLAIKNLVNHLTSDGVLIITTPNATAANVCIRSLLRKDINMLYDHMTTYYPENFQAICDRLGFDLNSIYMFDFTDKRNLTLRFKSFLFKFMTWLSPRLASSMMIIIKRAVPPPHFKQRSVVG